MKECVILAGGLGSRLGNIAIDTPKCLVQILEKPFIYYLFDYVVRENFDHVILSLGHGASQIATWLEGNKFPFEVSIVVEKEQLGTGGAIKNAISAVKGNHTFVMNGDTLFKVDTEAMEDLYLKQGADILIALKPMMNIERYGSVTLNEHGRIIKFKEKEHLQQGLINGGVYIIDKRLFSNISESVFSFEKNILENTDQYRVFGSVEDAYFIDVGTPEDYEKANVEFLNF